MTATCDICGRDAEDTREGLEETAVGMLCLTCIDTGDDDDADGPPFVCEECEEPFLTQDALNGHTNKHRDRPDESLYDGDRNRYIGPHSSVGHFFEDCSSLANTDPDDIRLADSDLPTCEQCLDRAAFEGMEADA